MSNYTSLEELLKEKDCLKILSDKGINLRYDESYILLKYKSVFQDGETVVDFGDPIVQQCRGTIIKKTDDGYEIVARPFDKFFNIQEEFASDIDWASARVQEKLDGSLIKLWYDDGWHWSTMGTINADYAETGMTTFGNIIRKAENYKDIDYDKLDKSLTYMFELVSPYTQIVIKYPKSYLYHIGTRKRTGEEINVDIGIKKPKEYPLHTKDECLEAAEKLNPDEVKNEGFVVVDKYWRRVKIKSPKYVIYHRTWNNGAVKIDTLLEIINSGGMRTAIEDFPLLREDFLKLNAAIAIYEYELEYCIRLGRQYAEEYETRAAAANFIKKLKYPFAGFWAIDHDGHAEDLIATMSRRKYINALKACL